MSSRWFQLHLVRPIQAFFRSNWARPTAVLLTLLLLMPLAALAQGGSPFDSGFTAIQALFTGTIAKVASLVAIVIGGYGFAHGEPGAKKALAGVAASSRRPGSLSQLCWRNARRSSSCNSSALPRTSLIRAQRPGVIAPTPTRSRRAATPWPWPIPALPCGGRRPALPPSPPPSCRRNTASRPPAPAADRAPPAASGLHPPPAFPPTVRRRLQFRRLRDPPVSRPRPVWPPRAGARNPPGSAASVAPPPP